MTPSSPGPRGRPFQVRDEPRRGRGPKKGAPNAGRPPDWLKATQRLQREQALELVGRRLDEDALDANQLLRIVKEYAPSDETPGVEVTVEPDGSVRLRMGGYARPL